MKMLVELGHETITDIVAEALERDLPFERVVADRMRRTMPKDNGGMLSDGARRMVLGVPPSNEQLTHKERVAKNRSIVENHARIRMERVSKDAESGDQLPDDFRAPDRLVERIRMRCCVTISDLYDLVDCTNSVVRKHFTMNRLIKCFPTDIQEMFTENQLRGWPASFHKYMTERMHIDFDNTYQPMRYWRTRRDG